MNTEYDGELRGDSYSDFMGDTDYEGSQADHAILEADEKDAYMEARYEQSQEDYQLRDLD